MPSFVSLKDQGFFDAGQNLVDFAKNWQQMRMNRLLTPLQAEQLKASTRGANATAATTEAGLPFIAPKAKADIASSGATTRATNVSTDKSEASRPYWASGARSEDEAKFHAAQAGELANKGTALGQAMNRSFLEDSGYKLPEISLRQYQPPPGAGGVQPLQSPAPVIPAQPTPPPVPQGAGPGQWQMLGPETSNEDRAALTNLLPPTHYKVVPSPDGQSGNEWVYMPHTTPPAVVPPSTSQMPDVHRAMLSDGNGGFKAVFIGPQKDENRNGVVGFSKVNPRTGVREFEPNQQMTTARDNRTHMKEVFRGMAELEDTIRRNGTWEAPYVSNQEDRGKLQSLPPLVATQLTQLLTGLGATQGKVNYDLEHLLPLGMTSSRGETFSRLYQIKRSVLDSIKEAGLATPLPQGATEAGMIAEGENRIRNGEKREKIEQFLNQYGLTLSTGVEKNSAFGK